MPYKLFEVQSKHAVYSKHLTKVQSRLLFCLDWTTEYGGKWPLFIYGEYTYYPTGTLLTRGLLVAC